MRIAQPIRSSLFLLFARRGAADCDLAVQTTSGLIQGHYATSTADVVEFLGIPYAQPPTQSLRFAAPRALEHASAAVYPDCLGNLAPPSTFPGFTGNGFRVFNTFTGHTGNAQSEDCLALNVWAKSKSRSRKRPVLIFLHGGRFVIPGPHNPFYNGAHLAKAEDVIVVTINYRLGIFGFSGAPDTEQNVGILDQRLAVEWVHANIASFGGDSARIVLWGQSSGAASVDYHSYAWKHDPIAAGLISNSGTALSFNPNTAEYTQGSFYNVSGTLGCGGAGDDPATVVACVRSQNASAVLAASARPPALPTKQLVQPVFQPTVDNVTVFGNYSALSEAHAFAKIPYLLGNNANEDGTYRVNAYAANLTLLDAQWAAFDRTAFTCPTAHEANSRSSAGVPVFRWFNEGDWPNLRLFNGSGAYHGSEMSLIFGTTLGLTEEADTVAEAAVSRYWMRAYAAFARDPVSGLAKLGWPRYRPKSPKLNIIARNNSRKPTFVSPSSIDSLCPAFNDSSAGMGAF